MRDGSALKNLHVPLTEPIYRRLRAESERSKRPATELAREAIHDWLERARRAEIHAEIARYAAAHGGGPEDLDTRLEQATGCRLLLAGAVERPRQSGGS